MTEQVLVVPRDVLPDAAGVVRAPNGRPRRTSRRSSPARAGSCRVPRWRSTRRHKQIIPYLVLRDGPRYFLMQRTRAGADARLHDRFSIGVGGHLNPGDDGLVGGLRREWAEEVVADFVPTFELVALLNDDTTEVGAVHLGAVYVADAEGRAVSIRETDKLTGSFVDRDAVEAVADRLETWSRLVYEFLEGAASPAGRS